MGYGSFCNIFLKFVLTRTTEETKTGNVRMSGGLSQKYNLLSQVVTTNSK